MSIEEFFEELDKSNYEKVKSILSKFPDNAEKSLMRILTMIYQNEIKSVDLEIKNFYNRFFEILSEQQKFKYHLLKSRNLIIRNKFDAAQSEIDICLTKLDKYKITNNSEKWWLGYFYYQLSRVNISCGKFKEALSDVEKSLSLYEKLDNEYSRNRNVGRLYLIKGNIQYMLGLYQKAEDSLNIALNKYHFLNNNKQMANSLNLLGTIKSTQGKENEALKFYQEALDCSQHFPPDETIISVLHNLANIHSQNANYHDALNYIDKAFLLVNQESPDFPYLMMKKAEIHNNQGLSDKAINEINLVCELIKNKQSMDYAYALKHKGEIYISRGEVDNGLKYLTESSEIFENNKNLDEHARLIGLIGKAYESKLQFKDAENKFLEYLIIREKLGQDFGKSMARFHLARLEFKKGNLESARVSLSNLLVITQKYQVLLFTSTIYHYLGEISRLKGDYSLATEYNNKAKDLLNQTNNKIHLQKMLYLSGKIAKEQGDFHKMRVDFRESLNLANATNDYLAQAKVLFEIAVDEIESGNLENTEKILMDLETIRTRSKNPKLNAIVQITRGYLFKKKEEGQLLFDAMRIFEEIKNRDALDIELKVFLMINEFDIHLAEYKLFKNDTTLEKMRSILNTLQNLSTIYRNVHMKMNLYLTSIQMAILNLEFSNANELINEVHQFALKTQNQLYIDIVEKEKKEFDNYLHEIGMISDITIQLRDEKKSDRISDYIKNLFDSGLIFPRDLDMTEDELQKKFK